MGRPKNFDPDAVIARAMEVFWTNGYAETSPADLAAATGVAKGSLYHTFGSKRELFDKALDRYDRIGAEVTAEFLDQPGTAKERIRAYLTFLVDLDVKGPVKRGCLAANTAVELARRDPDAKRKIRRIEDRSIELLRARIEQGQRDGDVAPDVDPHTQAQFLMTTIMGLRVMAQTFDRKTLHRIIDTALAGL